MKSTSTRSRGHSSDHSSSRFPSIMDLCTAGSMQGILVADLQGSCLHPSMCRLLPTWTPLQPSQVACQGSRPSNASSHLLKSLDSNVVSLASSSVDKVVLYRPLAQNSAAVRSAKQETWKAHNRSLPDEQQQMWPLRSSNQDMAYHSSISPTNRSRSYKHRISCCKDFHWEPAHEMPK